MLYLYDNVMPTVPSAFRLVILKPSTAYFEKSRPLCWCSGKVLCLGELPPPAVNGNGMLRCRYGTGMMGLGFLILPGVKLEKGLLAGQPTLSTLEVCTHASELSSLG